MLYVSNGHDVKFSTELTTPPIHVIRFSLTSRQHIPTLQQVCHNFDPSFDLTVLNCCGPVCFSLSHSLHMNTVTSVSRPAPLSYLCRSTWLASINPPSGFERYSTPLGCPGNQVVLHTSKCSESLNPRFFIPSRVHSCVATYVLSHPPRARDIGQRLRGERTSEWRGGGVAW